MRYKTVIVDESSKAKPMAAAVETKANEMAELGYELVTMAITGSAKAILVFKIETEQPEPAQATENEMTLEATEE